MPFHQQSSDGWRKDEIRALDALYFLYYSDAVGWPTGITFEPKKPNHLTPKVLIQNK